MDNKLNEHLYEDLVSMHQYQEQNKVESYFLLANDSKGETYLTAYRHGDNINNLIANLELALTELKMRVIMTNMEDDNKA